MLIRSWGRALVGDSEILQPPWLSPEAASLIKKNKNVLPYGCGRSYGDVCLNDGGAAVYTTNLDHIIAFDRETGVIRCEAGITLAGILAVCVPAGWFLPVTPGTKYVSLGGAIANDVHGKNQHVRGTFGCHVRCFELIRSDGVYLCSARENQGLYRATIGGLGLTGLIGWAEVRLKPVQSLYLDVETNLFSGLDDYFALAEEQNRHHEYTVAWVDCLTRKNSVGVFMAGDHGAASSADELKAHRVKHPELNMPVNAPRIASSDINAKLFNRLYYVLQKKSLGPARQRYESFFYPLDALGRWNLFYGKSGFFQLQFVVPKGNTEALSDVVRELRAAGLYSFLSVAKLFGDRPSPGMMSFPMPGYTLALDFPNKGQMTVKTLKRISGVVQEAGGRIYPAKDATMPGEVFRACYEARLTEFRQYVDPHFSSSFWRRCAE